MNFSRRGKSQQQPVHKLDIIFKMVRFITVSDIKTAAIKETDVFRELFVKLRDKRPRTYFKAVRDI